MSTPKKKKRLPANFEDMLATADLSALKAVFSTCDPDARGGYDKQTALAFFNCPDELSRWLVTQGADLNATGTLGQTPLHARAGRRQAKVDVLLELGANVNATDSSNQTPLHTAAQRMNVPSAAMLIVHGAVIDAHDNEGHTPLELALCNCPNNELPAMVELAKLLLDAGAKRTPAMRECVERIGKQFEFHRANYTKDRVADASAALDELYAIFEVTPIQRRKLHDGTSPIVVKDGPWQNQHNDLWDLLVPSTGPAATVQGEVIRISGRIDRELMGNGGGNWDDQYRKMARAFLVYVGSGTPLSAPELASANTLVDELVRHANCDLDRMGELAVAWIRRNPNPMPLPETRGYDR